MPQRKRTKMKNLYIFISFIVLEFAIVSFMSGNIKIAIEHTIKDAWIGCLLVMANIFYAVFYSDI